MISNSSVNKKYYSTSEVTGLLNIAFHQLRYLETKITTLSNYKVKNRKYYTSQDLEIFKAYLSTKPHLVSQSFTPESHITFLNSSNKIDELITKFNILSNNIKQTLASLSTSRKRIY